MSSFDSGLPDFEYTLPADLQDAYEEAEESWDAAGNTERLWAKDPSLWTAKDEDRWLGWLTIVEQQLGQTSKFKALAAEIAEDGFQHFVLLGMGGSSLCPEVLAKTWGKQANAPELLVLDSTDPLQIMELRNKIDPARTLFCVSSKPGTALEPNIYLQYFFEETKKIAGESAGRHFIAITNHGSKLEQLAGELKFRNVYFGDKSTGGRYSALSDFGMVPATAMGIDTEQFLKRTMEMVAACREPKAAENPGVQLGLVLITAALNFKRDKITLIGTQTLAHLGAWLENLLAESTNKLGTGLIAVDREPIYSPDEYGQDRLFVYIKYLNDAGASLEPAVETIETAGQPLVRLVVNDLYELGQVFFQWEFATAVAGSILHINPFDEPDLGAGEIITQELAEALERDGTLPEETAVLDHDGMKLFADPVNAKALTSNSHLTLGGVIRTHIDRLRDGDYFALLAYMPMFPEYEEKLQRIRVQITSHKHVATVLGFGSGLRYSARQAYGWGPNSGVFLQITCDDAFDVPVPGQKYTFGAVKAAQARGDSAALAERKRRALRIHLGKDVGAGLDRLRDLIAAGLSH